ncbi:nucleoside triphosphate pyrophosphohydrolase [Tersicoccus sp. MR15.9]|uniref:nucleoside triphosphate pyrophosphohydrolase n=1 Tax=Tersicoccus mangrovi TaxID=3121635 RepID=UPI002FE56636
MDDSVMGSPDGAKDCAGSTGKLVRDGVPEITASRGGRYVTRIMDHTEYVACLRSKLAEEADEVIEATTRAGRLEEIGDVLDVVDALIEAEGFHPEQVDEQRRQKRRSHGTFAGRVLSTEFVASSDATEERDR